MTLFATYIKKSIYAFALLYCVLLTGQYMPPEWEKLSVKGEEFNTSTNIVYQDRIGYLWIGTNHGLFRYDGQTLVEYLQDDFDKHSLPNNTVNSILEDDFGNLWIGTESYLTLYHRGDNNFYSFYKDNFTRVFKRLSDGTIYANLRNIGYVKITPSEDVKNLVFETSHNYVNSVSPFSNNGTLNDILEGDRGKIWIASDNGIFCSDGKAIVKSSFTESTLSLMAHTDNSFLALTNKGLFRLSYQEDSNDLHIIEHHTIDLDKSEAPIMLAQDGTNDYHYALTQKKIVRSVHEPNELEKIIEILETDNSGVSLNFKSLMVDEHENMWLATSKGVYIKTKQEMTFKTIPIPFQNDKRVRSLYMNETGTLYFGSEDGFVYYGSPNNFEQAEIGGSIRTMMSMKEENKLWIGAGNEIRQLNLNDLSSKIIKTYNAPVRNIQAIGPNEICVGLWSKGIDFVNTSSEISDFKKNLIAKIGKQNVSTLHLDKYNRLWIGTRGEGVFLIDLDAEELVHLYPRKGKGINSTAILCFLELNDKMYIGTRGGGVNVYDFKTERFSIYGKKHGLNSPVATSMESDSKGNIWIITIKGISLFDPKEGTFTNFGYKDGLQQNQLLFVKHIKDKQGNIYYTDGNGVSVIYPDKFEKKEKLAQTLITGFEILETSNTVSDSLNTSPKSIFHEQKTILPYDKNNIIIKFTSLDFTAPEKNKYAYKMEGVNDYWIYGASNDNAVNYSNLSPGTYTFKVKSTNSHGVWNHTPAEMKLTITPPFWGSDLAILTYGILFVTITLITVKLTKNWFQMKKNLVAEMVSHQKDNELHKMKMVFFTDISHELKTPLTLIQGTIGKVIREKKYKLKENTAKRIHRNALRIGRLIDQIMDIRKNEVGVFELKVCKGDIVRDSENLKKAFDDFSRIHNIEYHFKSDHDKVEAYYDLEILEKILFNLLSNAFKYTAKNGRIDVLLKRRSIGLEQSILKKIKVGDYLEFSVIDNGLGIPADDLPYIFDRYYQSTNLAANQVPGTGIGMELVQKLVNAHGGTISVESKENNYTKFSFLLPISKSLYEENQILSDDSQREPSIITKSEYQVFEEVTSDGLYKEENMAETQFKILLVDDNQELRLMIKEDLQGEFEIIEAENGQDGFQRAIEDQPNLIISDILMPVDDGISMLKRLKDDPTSKDIPVFMLTSRNSEESKIDCLSFGAADYIEKPFSSNFLKWKIRNILGSRASLKQKYSKVISVDTSEVELESNDEKLIRKLIIIVEEALEDSTLSVEYLAAKAGMSRANLYRKLRAILNETPVNFIKRIRLKRACQLLRKSNMYISEVAYMVGFSNPKYFAKCFNKEYGLSPKDYVKRNRTEKENGLKKNFEELIGDAG